MSAIKRVPNPKAKKPKRKPKASYKVADELFSKIVRLRDGYCQMCGSGDWLQCAHGFSRRYRAVRWDERNAWALCRACHTYFTHHPIEWDDWLRKEWGDLYDGIRQAALSNPNPDPAEVVAALRIRLDALGGT